MRKSHAQAQFRPSRFSTRVVTTPRSADRTLIAVYPEPIYHYSHSSSYERYRSRLRCFCRVLGLQPMPLPAFLSTCCEFVPQTTKCVYLSTPSHRHLHRSVKRSTGRSAYPPKNQPVRELAHGVIPPPHLLILLADLSSHHPRASPAATSPCGSGNLLPARSCFSLLVHYSTYEQQTAVCRAPLPWYDRRAPSGVRSHQQSHV